MATCIPRPNENSCWSRVINTVVSSRTLATSIPSHLIVLSEAVSSCIRFVVTRSHLKSLRAYFGNRPVQHTLNGPCLSQVWLQQAVYEVQWSFTLSSGFKKASQRIFWALLKWCFPWQPFWELLLLVQLWPSLSRNALLSDAALRDRERDRGVMFC